MISTLFQSLNVERRVSTWVGNQASTDWQPNGLTVEGALSAADPRVRELYGQDEQEQMYTLSAPGKRYSQAQVGDRLSDAQGGHYYIRGFDDVSSGGRWCSY